MKQKQQNHIEQIKISSLVEIQQIRGLAMSKFSNIFPQFNIFEYVKLRVGLIYFLLCSHQQNDFKVYSFYTHSEIIEPWPLYVHEKYNKIYFAYVDITLNIFCLLSTLHL